MSQYIVHTNAQTVSGRWEIHADDQGTVVGSYADPDQVRGHLHDVGLDVEADTVDMDVDGNGSWRPVPIRWIGDGEPLIGSARALALAE